MDCVSSLSMQCQACLPAEYPTLRKVGELPAFTTVMMRHEVGLCL